MRIQESDICLSSQHEKDWRRELDITSEYSFKSFFDQAAQVGQTEKSGQKEKVGENHERLMRLLQSLVDAILAAMRGKKCRSDVEDCRGLPEMSTPAETARPTLEWHRSYFERIEEHERTQVQGKGTVKTSDGRSIDFSLDVDMCRDYRCVREAEESGKIVLQDPLVINFDGKAAELTEERFDFDLNADGKVERLAGLGEGNGFLVLDRNGNGRADDGSELFGTRSGNGFADLAKLDGDGNGWLDEADPAFAQIKVWRGGKNADSKLTGLRENGIGALWLGQTESAFSLKDSANRLLGEIRASGLYLREDGRAGSLQQVDLAVGEPGSVKEKSDVKAAV